MTARKPTVKIREGKVEHPAHDAAETDRQKKGKYQFVTGATLVALEDRVNQLIDEHPDLTLKQVLFAQGTGFVAVLERPA
ncbi:hypothetical protein DIE15_33415 [Burkholderia sp. Bp9031]|uniref:hypothetical protein n=1 Tax=Burkholderia sp. Bp9031 TaxID=2184566 RepID=UPI000A92DEAD|nr:MULTISPECIES: hypothetical protein [Burkholderia]RQZ07983.1 hypothetical protein DIE15_33415 [Burkholderia sp. Bp9031]